MQPRHVSILGYAAVVAAACASALTTARAHAESPTIDNTPFVSTRTRAEVRAEVMNPRASLGYNEWAQQGNDMQPMASTTTRADVIAELRASREQTRAFTGEDSGSAYLARRMDASRPNMMLARAAR